MHYTGPFHFFDDDYSPRKKVSYQYEAHADNGHSSTV